MADPSASSEVKVNPYDAQQVKHTLDDGVANVVENLLFEVDQSHSNKKLLAGFVAVSVAIASHLAPIPFPQNWYLLLGSVLLYLVLSFLMTRWEHERGDVFLKTKPKSDKRLIFSSTLHLNHENGDCEYELKVRESRNEGEAGTAISVKKSITEWIDKNGRFYPGLFRLTVEGLLEEAKGEKKKK